MIHRWCNFNMEILSLLVATPASHCLAKPLAQYVLRTRACINCDLRYAQDVVLPVEWSWNKNGNELGANKSLSFMPCSCVFIYRLRCLRRKLQPYKIFRSIVCQCCASSCAFMRWADGEKQSSIHQLLVLKTLLVHVTNTTHRSLPFYVLCLAS